MQYLAFLACPLSMGAMMWWMMRGNRGNTGGAASRAARIEQLQQEIDALRGSEDQLPAAEPQRVHNAY